MTRAKRCPECGRPMRVELNGKVVGGKGATVTLWYCERCDFGEHEVRQA